MARNLLDDSEIKMAIPKSNVLIYYTEDGSKFVRDQAERNQKFYISVNTILDDVEDFKSRSCFRPKLKYYYRNAIDLMDKSLIKLLPYKTI
jgi:hypothetical protein